MRRNNNSTNFLSVILFFVALGVLLFGLYLIYQKNDINSQVNILKLENGRLQEQIIELSKEEDIVQNI